MRIVITLAISLFVVVHAATLEKLSVEEMSQKSTLVLKGRILSCAGELRGSVIYTRCQIAVHERWKGQSSDRTSFIVPGGTVRDIRQTFTGVPRFDPGLDYVVFLWAGKSGVNQVIGLSQGVFDVKSLGKTLLAKREASTETMLNAQGNSVEDTAVRMGLDKLRSRVSRALGEAR